MKKLIRKIYQTAVISGIVLSTNIATAQTTVIDFTTNPYINTGPNTWNPNYFNNTGCSHNNSAYYKYFGPNPTPLNAHNIRTAGGPGFNMLDRHLEMDTHRFVNVSGVSNGSSNDILSIEYPFKANKNYVIELIGYLNKHIWSYDIPNIRTVYNGVFWIKLDDSPEIDSPYDKCNGSSHPVFKVVNRYSKLVADPDRAMRTVNYSVSFSVLENKNAVKIIHDFGPADNSIAIARQIDLEQVKITEMDFIDDGPSYTASYTNLPRPRPWNPSYEIPGVVVRPQRGSPEGRPKALTTSISPEKWTLNSDGSGYSVYLSDIIANLNVSKVHYLDLLGDVVPAGPRGGTGRQTIILPGSYQGNNYSFNLFNKDIVITVKNTSATPPTSTIDLSLAYYE